MAGAGYRTFVDGDVLTAAQVNTYLMEQAVMVFATATARTTALPTPSEGMVTYRADADVLEVWTGAAWVAIDANAVLKSLFDAKGDLLVASADNTPARLAAGTNEHRLVANSATATGLAYVADTTNYAIAAKGDLLVGTAADTVTNLPVGTNGHVLTANSSTATGLQWVAPAAGGKVLQVVSATTSTAMFTTGTTFTDTNLTASITPSAASSKILVLISQPLLMDISASSATISFRVLRGSTTIYDTSDNNTDGSFVSVATGATYILAGTVIPAVYLDSPSTTSATTYKTQICRHSSSNTTARAQWGGTTSSIVLMEIGA